jgi:gluconokinase
VFTCSALKEKYRATLLTPGDGTLLVYLRGSFEIIQARVAQRQGHYLKAGLVESQFDALEEPKDAFTLDVTRTPGDIVQAILARVGAANDKP